MVPLLFVVALLVGYVWPVFILVMFPFLLLYGGVWALAPLLIAVIALVNKRAEKGTTQRRTRTEPEYKAGYES
jgi:ABC-type protease/lipase transport system fused ATPase/permease subunit